jgi:hypothetical protein
VTAVSWSPAIPSGALVSNVQGPAHVKRLVTSGCDNTIRVGEAHSISADLHVPLRWGCCTQVLTSPRIQTLHMHMLVEDHAVTTLFKALEPEVLTSPVLFACPCWLWVENTCLRCTLCFIVMTSSPPCSAAEVYLYFPHVTQASPIQTPVHLRSGDVQTLQAYGRRRRRCLAIQTGCGMWHGRPTWACLAQPLPVQARMDR